MSLSKRPPSAGRTTFQRWAERLNDWLVYTRSRLAFFQTGDTPTEDGIILWDQEGYPVVSKDNVWRQVLLAEGYGEASSTVTLVAPAPNTAYSVIFNQATFSPQITWSAADPTKIYFGEDGVYTIDGHLQLKSSSGSAKNLWYFASVDGASLGHSERQTISTNNSYFTMSISDVITVQKGSYLELKWAVDDVNLWLDGSAATAFAPAAFAVELYVSRIQQ
tara:strand:- start:4665 stop:5324 length:660 start_codon:yes stop_codon:yes gene_type:complete